MWQRQEYDRPADVLFARPTNRAIKSGMIYEDEKPQPLAVEKKSGKRIKFKFGLLALQTIISCIVLLFVLLIGALSPEFYDEIKLQYADLMSYTLSQGEQQVALELTEDALAILGDEPQNIEGTVPQISDNTTLPAQDQTALAQGAPDSINEEFSASDVAYTLDFEPLLPIENATFTSGFGIRESPITGEEEFHSGLDLAAPDGSEVVAVANGIVTMSGQDRIGGNYVIIDHGDGFESGYYHLDSRLAELGEEISAGETLGIIGDTGLSTGVHLHLTFLLNGSKVNPTHAYPEGTFE